MLCARCIPALLYGVSYPPSLPTCTYGNAVLCTLWYLYPGIIPGIIPGISETSIVQQYRYVVSYQYSSTGIICYTWYVRTENARGTK